MNGSYKNLFIAIVCVITCLLHGSNDIFFHETRDKRLDIYEEVQCDLLLICSPHSERSHPYLPGPLEPFYRSPKVVNRSSTNWTGYVAVADVAHPKSKTISSVAASWIAPSIGSSPIDTYSAIWIGIDGFNNSTVEQIGTAHNWLNGAQQHYAWFEMYPGSSYMIAGFPIHAGDSISASIDCSKNGVFMMTIYNNTRKTYVMIPPARTTSMHAQRNSAEWIVEAPFLNTVLPLAQFDTISLSQCTATINNVSHAIGDLPNIQIIMASPTGTIKAASSALKTDKKSFDVTWHHA